MLKYILVLLAFTPMLQAMESLEVSHVYHFQNPDDGAGFFLSDGSFWSQTREHGPIYHLQSGQKVALTPMSEEEIQSQNLTSTIYCQPYWLSIEPNPGEANVAIVYIVFKHNLEASLRATEALFYIKV